jgi:hypothetical protein
MGAEPVQQFVGSRLEAGLAQGLDVLVKAEEPAGPVAASSSPSGPSSPAPSASAGSLPSVMDSSLSICRAGQGVV